MAKTYGDIELINGKIINCLIDPVDSMPEFTASEESRVIYNKSSKQLLVNDGEQYQVIQFSISGSDPLKNSLGANWLNHDLTFNPTPFNELENIEGLTADNNLFDVLAQFDTNITEAKEVTLNKIDQVIVDDLQLGDILYFDGENFINGPLNDVPNFEIQLSLNELTDVQIEEAIADNEVLIYDSSISKFVTKKWIHNYQELNTNTVHVITHNLNNRYPSVTLINLSTNQKILDSDVTSVTFDNANQLTVVLNSPLALAVAVVGVAG